MESAFSHGYLAARVKGYAEKRDRARHRIHESPASTDPSVSGWQQLAAKFPDRVQHGGERLVN